MVNKDINRRVSFAKIMYNFCLLLTKIVNEDGTQRVRNTPCLKTDKHVQRVGMPVTVLTTESSSSCWWICLCNMQYGISLTLTRWAAGALMERAVAAQLGNEFCS